MGICAGAKGLKEDLHTKTYLRNFHTTASTVLF